MLSREKIQAFHRDGFVLGEQVLNDAEVDELREEMQRVIRDSGDASKPQPVLCRNLAGGGAEIWQIVNIWEASDAFRRLIHHPKLVSQLDGLIEAEELRVFHDQVQYKPAAKGGVNWWHQDSMYWPILEPKNTEITAWVALDDVDPDNGCMSMVPGSHQWGDQIAYLHELLRTQGNKAFLDIPRTFQGRAIEVRPCPVKKGQVHFHHALCWHGSQANESGRPRRAVAIHLMSDQTAFNEKGEHPMKGFIDVRDGEKVEGEHFPVVWRRERAAVGV